MVSKKHIEEPTTRFGNIGFVLLVIVLAVDIFYLFILPKFSIDLANSIFVFVLLFTLVLVSISVTLCITQLERKKTVLSIIGSILSFLLLLLALFFFMLYFFHV